MLSSLLSAFFNLLLRIYDATIGAGLFAPATPEADRATVYLDTETGGFDALTPDGFGHEVIEFAMVVEQHGEVTHTFSLKVKPEREVSPGAAKINGYTPEGWADAPSKAEAALLIKEEWRKAVVKYTVPGESKPRRLFPTVVGHNVRFDLHFMDTMMQENLPADERFRTLSTGGIIDTLTMAKRLNVPSHRLDYLRRWFGWSTEGAHTAMVDVMQTRDLHHFLRDAGPCRLFIAGLMGRWRTTMERAPQAHG